MKMQQTEGRRSAVRRAPPEQAEVPGREARAGGILRYVSLLGLILCAVLAVLAWNSGLLTSRQAMSAFIRRAGFWGPLLFLLLQTVQVVIPILPGGVSCLAGVLIFGPWCGFLYNYLGICAGSMLAFLIARHFGRPLLGRIFRPEQLERYDRWMRSRRHLSRRLEAVGQRLAAIYQMCIRDRSHIVTPPISFYRRSIPSFLKQHINPA